MKSTQWLGLALVLLPFMAIPVLLIRMMGWREFLVTFGLAVAVIACILGGMYLLTDGR